MVTEQPDLADHFACVIPSIPTVALQIGDILKKVWLKG